MPGAAPAPSPGFASAAKKASPFVSARGTHFVVNGKVTYFSGTNAYFLLLRCVLPARSLCCPAHIAMQSHLRTLAEQPAR